jgi:integrase
MEMLQALKTITCKYTHLLRHRDERTRPMFQHHFARCFVLGWGGKYSPHAIRTTGSTRLNEMGFSAGWIERQLTHTEHNEIRRTYHHAEYTSLITSIPLGVFILSESLKSSPSLPKV